MADMFLAISGIQGEATREGHGDEIVVQGWSWGASVGESDPGRGGTRRPGKPVVSNMIIDKSIDRASPELIDAIFTGKVFEQAVLTVLTPSSVADLSSNPFLTITMDNVSIISVADTGDADDHAERIALDFTKFTYRYIVLAGNGTQLDAVETSH